MHGPHDHEIEHAVEHAAHGEGAGGMINQIAMFTAIIATVGAIFSQAFYQAKIDRYEKEKKEIETEPNKLDAESAEWDKRSAEQMHQHHRWAQATTVLQVSIALAAIALLTRKKWLEWGMFGMGAVGVAIGALAVLHI